MSQLIWANSFIDWTRALAVSAAVALIGYGLVRLLGRRIQEMSSRTSTRLDDVFASLVAATRWWFLGLCGLYIGSHWLALGEREQRLLHDGLVIVLLVQAALWGDAAIRRWLQQGLEQARQHPHGAASAAVVGFIGRALVWVIALLMILDNLGFNISTLIASLGIGGVAVALAVQNILGDIFASLSILLDKPFALGDFIIVGDALGTVEYIGLKTTRIRALGGEQIVFSNAELLRSRIHNHQRLQERRTVFMFGVSYDTTAAQLRRIPAIVREAIKAHEKVRFDRAHFRSYGESALEFEAVYFVTSPDFNLMMDYQQDINLALYERFEREGITFAAPRRLIQLPKSERRMA